MHGNLILRRLYTISDEVLSRILEIVAKPETKEEHLLALNTTFNNYQLHAYMYI